MPNCKNLTQNGTRVAKRVFVRATAASDGYGHGTHVAGLVASQYVGVASQARLIGLKVLDANGRGTTDNVVRAIEFAIANKTLLGLGDDDNIVWGNTAQHGNAISWSGGVVKSGNSRGRRSVKKAGVN